MLEYFISTHGARKGLADTALKTADSGYLTRKLVDAAQDVIITEPDCGTVSGIIVRPIYRGDEEGSVFPRATSVARAAKPSRTLSRRKVILKSARSSTRKPPMPSNKDGVEQLKIRSATHLRIEAWCVCARCYGRNLATGREVKLGEAVGIIAAQSIGEPGTQLTMRTFHVGGTASQTFKQHFIKPRTTRRSASTTSAPVQSARRHVHCPEQEWLREPSREGWPRSRELQRSCCSVISIADGAHVKKVKPSFQWDPYNVPIITEKAGKIEFRDMIPAVTIRKEVDEATGVMGVVVIEHKEDLHPQIVIVDDRKEVLASYSIPAALTSRSRKARRSRRASVSPRTHAKDREDEGHHRRLPRVGELFEARRPKDAAEIAKIERHR